MGFEKKVPKEVIMQLFKLHDEIMRVNVSPFGIIEKWVKNNQNNLSDIECNFYESPEDVPDPLDLSSESKNLMIFDDLLLEK